MSRTSQRVAIVTGASKGIGAAIATRLAADGLAVIINYSRDAEPAEHLQRRLVASSGQALAVRGDVSSAADVRAVFDAAESAFGGVDIVVNNAGIMMLAPVADTSDDLFTRTVDVNLRGTFNVMREAAKRLRDGGRVINFSSSVVGLLQPGYGIYAATKAAVETLTMIVAREMRGRGITVNAVAPGPTATDLFLTGKSDELVDRLAKTPPLERLGQPEDIARVVSFLADPMAPGSMARPCGPMAASFSGPSAAMVSAFAARGAPDARSSSGHDPRWRRRCWRTCVRREIRGAY